MNQQCHLTGRTAVDFCSEGFMGRQLTLPKTKIGSLTTSYSELLMRLELTTSSLPKQTGQTAFNKLRKR